jgi:hypothetical protein
MLIHPKKFYVVLWCVSILFCGYVLADAYVLSGPHLIELMLTKMGRVKSLLVTQKLVLYGSRLGERPVELYEILRYKFPESFRSEIQSENVQRIQLVSKGTAVTAIDGSISADPETKFDYYKYILLYHSRPMLQEKLFMLGVDVSVSSIGRFHDTIAYVIGAQYPDESLPQLWIDKDTFLPFRWLTVGKNTASFFNSVEIRYLQWKQADKFWYPMHIQFFQNKLLQREIKVDRIEINTPFPGELFDIESFKSNHAHASDAGPVEKETGGLSEVQKTIEDFKKIFE